MNITQKNIKELVELISFKQFKVTVSNLKGERISSEIINKNIEESEESIDLDKAVELCTSVNLEVDTYIYIEDLNSVFEAHIKREEDGIVLDIWKKVGTELEIYLECGYLLAHEDFEEYLKD